MTTTYNETQRRTLTKTIVYRILSFFVASGLTLAYGGTLDQAFKFGLTSIALGLVIFYVYDRLWVKISWRRNSVGDEAKTRSVIKSIIYRIVAMIVTGLLARSMWADTSLIAILMVLSQFSINICTYFIQDRIWNKISWGKVIPE